MTLCTQESSYKRDKGVSKGNMWFVHLWMFREKKINWKAIIYFLEGQEAENKVFIQIKKWENGNNHFLMVNWKHFYCMFIPNTITYSYAKHKLTSQWSNSL